MVKNITGNDKRIFICGEGKIIGLRKGHVTAITSWVRMEIKKLKTWTGADKEMRFGLLLPTKGSLSNQSRHVAPREI